VRPFSGAPQTTAQLLSGLQAQIEDPGSALYSGSVTSTCVPGYFKFTTEVLAAGPAQAALAAQGYASASLLPWQEQGLFTLTSSEYYVTEADGAAVLTVVRSQAS
jgi:hypothetical protein